MVFDAEAAGAKARSHTIYVWPSNELIAQSWHWPASWHEAFEFATGRIGLAVAVCLLDGRPFARRRVTLDLSLGSVTFSVRRAGTSIVVTVSAFTGPEPPRPEGPDGGHRQPRAADGLVLGLRGSGRSYYLAVFHGHMPAVPAENRLPFATGCSLRESEWSGQLAVLAGTLAQASVWRRNPLAEKAPGPRSRVRIRTRGHADHRAISLAIPVALVSAPAWSAYLNPERGIRLSRLSGSQTGRGERTGPGRFADRSEPRTFFLDRRVPFDWRPLQVQQARFDYLQSRYLH
jgi:hypothetical protein